MTSSGEVDPRDLDDVAEHLYGLPLAEFLPARTALAKAARQTAERDAAREIGALRKPTVSAAAINWLSRRRPGLVRELVHLGDRLRAAQTHLDAATLRDLRGERERMLAEVVSGATVEAQAMGQRLSTAARDEIYASAVAALAGLEAAQAVASGRLTRALEYSGFGEVDLVDAVAQTSTGVRLSVLKGGRSDGAPTQPAESSAPEPTLHAHREQQDELNDRQGDQAGNGGSEPPAGARLVVRQAPEPDGDALEQARQEVAAAHADVLRVVQELSAAQRRLDAAERRLVELGEIQD